MSGFLYPGGGQSAPSAINGFRVQSSVYALPIPVVYGTARIAGNLIDFIQGDVSPVVSKPSKWATPTQTGWNYFASLALALCEGPIVGIGNVWAEKDQKADFDTLLQPVQLWDLKLGTSSQTALGYLSTAAAYRYLAYVADEVLGLPNNVLPNLSWEIQGLFIFGGGIDDALGSDVLSDVLTDAIHGANFPSASLASLTQYEDYCAAAGLFVSPAYDTLRRTADIVDELMTATNSAVVWSDGVLKVIPYGDSSLSGNGHTYTPNTTPLYDFTDDDYMAADGEDPVSVKRKNPQDRYNQLFVEFVNRDNDYNGDVAEAKNDSDILINGLLPAPKLSLPLIKDVDVARSIAQLRQQREQYVVNEYSWKAGWKFSLLEPMDLVTLSDVGEGLDFTPVRITEVVELENGDGIEFTAEDWPFGVATATLYPTQSNSGHRPNNTVDPGDTTTPVIFNGPGSLTINTLEVWIAASGGQYWGGCEVWLSVDNGVTYRKFGTINAKATFGVLTADLDSGSAFPLTDIVNTLSVDVTASGGSLDSLTADEFGALSPFCYVDQEFLAYQDAAITGAFTYDLTTLYRAIRASVQTPTPGHLIGSPFAFIDESIFKLFYPQGYAGQVLYFKFPAFNIYGNALQSLASATPVIYTVQNPAAGTTPSLDSVIATPTFTPCDGGGTMTVSWTAANMPVGTTFNVEIKVNGGTRGAKPAVMYYNVTSGDSLGADLCPDSFGVVTVTAVNGYIVSSATGTF
jgi:hypothetical protein